MRLGFIGIGDMGRPLALRLLRATWDAAAAAGRGSDDLSTIYRFIDELGASKLASQLNLPEQSI